MKKTFLATLQYVFFAALAVFFVWLSVRGLDHEKWEQLKKAMDRAHYWLLVPVFSLLLVAHCLRAHALETTYGAHGLSTFPGECFFCCHDRIFRKPGRTPAG